MVDLALKPVIYLPYFKVVMHCWVQNQTPCEVLSFCWDSESVFGPRCAGTWQLSFGQCFAVLQQWKDRQHVLLSLVFNILAMSYHIAVSWDTHLWGYAFMRRDLNTGTSVKCEYDKIHLRVVFEHLYTLWGCLNPTSYSHWILHSFLCFLM